MAALERELTNLMASVHTGQEGDHLEFESKALHAGMIDTIALEVAEIAQINLYDFPTGEADTQLQEIGMGVIDRDKPVILCIGHNVAPSTEIIDYADTTGVLEDLEICGLCCTALDQGRYSLSSKIAGPISRQLMFIKTGIPDVVVLDEQCIRPDIRELCRERNISVITTSDKCSLGLEDRTDDNPYRIIRDIAEGKIPGALIRDREKVGRIAVELALKKSMQKSFRTSEIPSLTECSPCTDCRPGCNETPLNTEKVTSFPEKSLEDCTGCAQCDRTCPAMLPISEAISEAREGNHEALEELYRACTGCGVCIESCPEKIPILNLIMHGARERIRKERYLIRSGRGPIQDIEIRRVGAPIVFGDIPGVILLAACSNYPDGEEDVAKIADEFLKRGYIVMAAGCAAMDIALYRDEEGKTLYEKYPGDFDRGGLLNLGPCVANSHAIASAIKISNIFARVPLERNFKEISDYILNRIGVCVITWGAMSQKAFAIATGANRWGIPVITGPHGSKYRRLYLGEEERVINDRRTGERVESEPGPPHLIYTAESLNECMVTVAKTCIRPNDTPRGRMIKLSNYIDLHMKYYGCLPQDLHLYIREDNEIPFKHRDEILKILKKMNWKPRKAPAEPLIIYQ